MSSWLRSELFKADFSIFEIPVPWVMIVSLSILCLV